MDAEARLLLVLAVAILPVGLVPIAIWLHDRLCAALALIGMVLEAFAAGYAVASLIDLLVMRAVFDDDYQVADAD